MAKYRILKLDTVSSTNDAAKEAALEGAPEGYAVAAAAQTAGRGRLGRSFSSPAGSGLYLSLVLRPGFSDSWLITVAAAVAMSEAIRREFGIETAIKWVNDLYIGDLKVCGILTETTVGAGGIDFAVLGVGVNLAPPEGGFEPELRGIAGALFDKNMPEDAFDRLAECFLDEFFAIYRQLPGTDFVERYRELSYLTGKRVLVPLPQGMREAQVLGIADDFALMVRYDDGSLQHLSTGEVSVKGFRQDPRRI